MTGNSDTFDINDLSSLFPWLPAGTGNAAQNNPSAQQFFQNPSDLVQAGLQNLGQSLGNPFTQFLAKNLSNNLQTLQGLYATDPAATGPNDFAKFGAQLLSSFYNKAPSPFNIDVGSTRAGDVISGLLHGTGQFGNSVIGQGFQQGASVGVDDNAVYQTINNVLDSFDPFQMSTLAQNMAKNQLTDLWGKYWAGGNQQYSSFKDYLANTAADWLHRWWGTNSGSDTSGTTSGNIR